MNRVASTLLVLATLLFPCLANAQDKTAAPVASHQGWQHSDTITILTTSEGANLPASAEGFPLLVRLHKDFFDFAQLKANGGDIRFSTSYGKVFTTSITPPNLKHARFTSGARNEIAMAACLLALARPDASAQQGGAKAADELKAPPPVRFDPVVREIEGWKIHVEPALIDGEHREEGAKALTMLANHLQRIKILVPPEPLAKLQAIEIWIEHDHPRLKSMQYHPSRDWLVANGHDPRLTRKVHITQARELLSRGQMLKHPAVVLHELAHGYHDQVLGFDQPEIVAAYNKAKASGSYTNVLLYTGKKVKHYGLTDHKEYFAEGTEAYFYRNDFYPFVRAELKEHDPTLHEVLVKIWGPAN